MIPKLMLADHTLDGCVSLPDTLTFPKLVLPKYDGIRIYIQGGYAYNRSGKRVPNSWLHGQLYGLPDGLEGEVVVNNNFADTTSCLRSFDKNNYDFKLFLFDNVAMNDVYSERLLSLYNAVTNCGLFRSTDKQYVNYGSVDVAESTFVETFDELLQLENQYVEQGFEGVIIRDPDAKYKHGRATFREQSYLSLKRVMTDTAKIIGYKCKLEDGVAVDTLGALQLDYMGAQPWCGSGLTDALRTELWSIKDELIGKYVEFKYQKSEQNAPRFPVFLRLV